jgi:hypothetical protein
MAAGNELLHHLFAVSDTDWNAAQGHMPHSVGTVFEDAIECHLGGFDEVLKWFTSWRSENRVS